MKSTEGPAIARRRQSSACFRIVSAISAALAILFLGLAVFQRGASLDRQATASRLVAAEAAGTLFTRPIEELRVGDLVWSLDPASGKRQKRRLAGVFRRTSQHLREITICAADGMRRQRLTTTDEHPFWVMGRGFVPAQQLCVGDRLLQSQGTLATVTSSRRQEHLAGVEVFNIEVEGNHTYFVAANGSRAPPVLVHNCNRGQQLRWQYAHLNSATRQQIIEQRSLLAWERHLGELISQQPFVYRYLTQSGYMASLRHGLVRGYATTIGTLSQAEAMQGGQILQRWPGQKATGPVEYVVLIPTQKLKGFSVSRPFGNQGTGWEPYTNSYPKAGHGGWPQFFIEPVPLDDVIILPLIPD